MSEIKVSLPWSLEPLLSSGGSGVSLQNSCNLCTIKCKMCTIFGVNRGLNGGAEHRYQRQSWRYFFAWTAVVGFVFRKDGRGMPFVIFKSGESHIPAMPF